MDYLLVIVPFVNGESHLSRFSVFRAGVGVAVVFREQIHVVKDETFKAFHQLRLIEANVHQHASVEWRAVCDVWCTV